MEMRSVKFRIKKYKKYEEMTDQEKLTYLKMEMDEPSISRYYNLFFQLMLLITVVLLVSMIYKVDAIYTKLNITYIPDGKELQTLQGLSNATGVVTVLLIIYAMFFCYDIFRFGKKYKGFKKSLLKK